MAIADRKRREWEDRERLIVTEADELLRERGYLGLNLDDLADRIEYSKATIYNHFCSKEDVVLAVANRHIAVRANYFGRALTFDGRTRERIFVIGIADAVMAERFPHGFATLQLVRTHSIWERAGEVTRQKFLSGNELCFRVPAEIVRQAREIGDLPDDAPPNEQILAGLVSMAKGAHLLAAEPVPLVKGSTLRPLDTLFANYHVFLDGAGWIPLSADWDYSESEQRIRTQLFENESAFAPEA